MTILAEAMPIFLFVIFGLAGANAGASACGGKQAGAARTVVDHYLVDPVLKRSWTVVVDCRYPQRPPSLTEVRDRPAGSQPAAPRSSNERAGLAGASSAKVWLRAGTPVRIWRNGAVRIQLSGRAVESALVGAEVMVRSADTGALLRGIVRGANSVELLPDATRWREQ